AGPLAIAIGDVNADGHLDIVTANSNAGSASVLPGDGPGSFGPRTDYGVGTFPGAVALGDLNGDGRLDIVTANHGGGTGTNVSILLGTGTGSFGAATNYLVGTAPMSVALADLNGDTRLVLVVANSVSNNVSVLFGTGTGSVGSAVNYATGSGPRTVVVADVNADGRFDVLTTNESDNTVSVLLGNGASGFNSLAPRVDLPTPQAPWGLAATDLNGDGRADAITTNTFDATAAVLMAKNPSRVSFTTNPTIPLPGTNYTLRAEVDTKFAASGTPTGTVRFYDRSSLIASVPVVGGIASFTTSNIPLAGHTLTATYTGDTRHTASSGSLTMPSSLAPRIVRIGDVPNDQGGRVTVQWYASPLDRTPGNPVYQYNIWRQVPGSFATSRVQQGEYRVGGIREAMLDRPVLRTTALGSQVFFWEFLATTVPRGFTGYSYLASTAADSTGGSNPRTAFMVEAMDYNLSGWSSEPDSGYSVDNLPPATPTPFAASYVAGATTLSWGRNREADLAGYRLYRGASAGFTPSDANRIAAPADTTFADAGPAGSYYKLSAMDSHGNESPYALVTPGGTTDVDGTIAPERTFLDAPNPNPVRALASIAFGLPTAASVSLGVYDVNGRQVRTLVEGAREAGRHTVAWDLRDDAGRSVPGGMYFARLRTGDRTWTQRFAVVR
ncbi:MAG: FG-GAP-like repeat-containing protein, partial [bacterium]